MSLSEAAPPKGANAKFPPPKAGARAPDGTPIKAGPKAPPPTFYYGAFKAGVRPDTPLQYNQVDTEEPQVTCETCSRHGRTTQVYLGRIPWQTRCVRCHSSWTAQDLNKYHEVVLSMAQSLPWRYHLRHSFKVITEPVVATDMGYGGSPWTLAPPPPPKDPWEEDSGDDAETSSEDDPWEEVAKVWIGQLEAWETELAAKEKQLRGIHRKEAELLRRSEIFEADKKASKNKATYVAEAAEEPSGSGASSSEAVDLSTMSIEVQQALMRQIQENLRQQQAQGSGQHP